MLSIEGSKVMLKLVRIATGCGVTSIMIVFVEVDAFGANFILVVAIAVGPFENSMSPTFNATARKDTTLASAN